MEWGKSTDRSGQAGEQIDHLLDAALKKYATVEPRAGLEERVLANLQTAQSQPVARWRWSWGLAGALTALLVTAGLFASRWDRTPKPLAANRLSVTTTARVAAFAKTATHPAEQNRTTAAKVRIAHRREPKEAAEPDSPKLDQFPSRRSLTENEKIALDYVREFPEEATLMARAQTNFARQEELEKVRSQPTPVSPSNEDQE